jgi:guanyl-specific ribonuclease Sa
MKSVRSRLWRLVPVLVVVAGLVIGRPRGPEARAGEAEAGEVAVKPVGSPASAPSASRPGADLSSVDGAQRRAQIERVIAAMDRTGAPPAGVAQGGRRGSRRGVFQNAEGRLPRKPRGYWIESDVWPKHGPRDTERLVFGREGEVYWTRDHYETFVRLR